MPTHLVTAATSERLATCLADALMEGEHHLPVSAAGAFEQAPPLWRFEAWFTAAPDLGEFTRTAARILGPEAADIRFDHRQVDDADWVAKSLEDLPPVRAGRFVVYGAHDRVKLRPNDVNLEIEASMAFGTGHHATTLGCLLALDRWVARQRATARPGPRRARRAILDIGTGTGVLALAIVKTTPRDAVAGDIDRESVRIARANARLAGAAHRVRVVEAAGIAHASIRARAPYPLVVANILARPLVALATDIARITVPGGTVILSGLLAWQARLVEAAYRMRGLHLVRRRIIGDWATLELARGRRRRLSRP
jgi:ribosomal protein L11 methyltransferase